MPGVYDVINLCRRKKIPMAIASSSSLQLIKQVAAQLNILNDMEFIHSAYEMDFGKPHPQVFIETGQRLNVDPQNCLVFEDSKFGVIAARAAMMKVIAVPDAIELGNKEFGIAHKVLSSLMEFTEEMLDKL
jgi:sugar-phosphatase